MEPSVRAWWMMAIGLALATLYFAVEQYALNAVVRRRVVTWRHQIVNVDKINTSSRKSYVVRPDTLRDSDVDMSYLDAAQQRHQLSGHLVGQINSVSPGSSVEVLINPNDPNDFTDRVIPTPLAEQMIIPAMMAPIPIVFAVTALLKRRNTLRLWQGGERREATVVDVTKSAVSPRSAIIRCTVSNTRDRRLIRLAIPRRLMDPHPGNTLAVITPPGDPKRAIAVMLYE
jgi:hypothetical protein